MPTKLKILVGLLGLSIALALVSMSWVTAVVNALLLLGVLKGNEGVRTLLIMLGALGLCGNAIVFIVAALGLANGYAVLALIAVAAGLLGTAQCGYFIWCLQQRDVQRWMFKRTMGDIDI
jgi:hypothetical protein